MLTTRASPFSFFLFCHDCAQLGSYAWIEKFAFPAWFGLGALIFVILETQKQYRRFVSSAFAVVVAKKGVY